MPQAKRLGPRPGTLRILGTKVEDFHKFGEALEPVIKSGGICVVGSAEACEKSQESVRGCD